MRKFICALFAALLMASTAYASYDIEARVYDGAGLLTAEQSASLKSTINSIIDAYNFDVVIVTVNSLDGKSAEAYADDYFDYGGFGFGGGHDGALFLIGMDDRDWHISTTGRGIQVINDARINEIKNKVVSYLSNGDYYGAFSRFLSMTEGYLQNPDAQDSGAGKIFAVWLVALVIALVSVILMKFQLNTARPQPAASDYTVKGSFHLTHKRDIFINSHTTRTPRPKESSSGGSSVHTGSSGTPHGGGGGKF